MWWSNHLSWQASAWAIEQQDITEPHARFVLVSLANYAGPTGENSFPSLARVCRDTGLSERTVRRCLRKLEEASLIVKGNQAIAAAHIGRSDKRPTLYNLVMSGGSHRPPVQGAGGQRDRSGGSNVHERGVTVAPNPILKSCTQPKSVKTLFEEEFEKRFGGKPR